MKTGRILIIILVFTAFFSGDLAQNVACDQAALDSIDAAQAEHSADISALFAGIDNIKVEWETCQSSASAAHSDGEEIQMSAGEIVDGGHIIEGLWAIKAEYTWSDACEERRKTETDEFFEDVYYNDDELLTWDGGNNYSNYTFEYLLTRRYIRDDSGHNWVQEREITSATPRSLSGTYTSYWQGNEQLWCSLDGTFTAELVETQNACLVVGDANIRTNPSTNSPVNGKIEDQRLVIEKVLGDDNYFWWQLSEDEYVREDVVGASRSCQRLPVGS